jgi:hypothetical protein
MKIMVTLSDLKLLLMSILSIVCLIGCGNGSSTTMPINASTPIIEVQPKNAAYAKNDIAIPVGLIASVNDGGVISYQWYNNTINSNEGGDIILGETSSSYTPVTLVAGTTYYYAVVTNTNNNAKEQKWASVASDTAKIDVDIFSASFYDKNLNLLTKDDMPLGLEVDFNSYKNRYGVDDWYLASNDTAVNSYTITDKNVNFYALPDITEITSQDDLASIKTNLAGKYILLNDIALDGDGAGFELVYGWIPIGNYDNRFVGIFNGNYHKISNLWVNRDREGLIGFFGNIENATISNFGVEIADGKNVSGTSVIGGITGRSANSIITNVYSTGNVGGSEICCVGGIVGTSDNSTITNVYSTANINSNSYGTGGIAGFVANSIITNVYSTGNVNSSDNYVGGIAGLLIGGSVTNSYSTGNINGINAIGGIVGENSESNGLIWDNAAINSFVYGQNFTNRILGNISDSNVTASNNFALDSMRGGASYDNSTNSFSNSSDTRYHGIDKTIEQLKTKETYSDAINGDGLGGLGWKFGDDVNNPWVWEAFDDYPYPTFYWQTQKP